MDTKRTTITPDRLRGLTVDNILRKQVKAWSDKVFLTWIPDGRSYTYADLERITANLASGFTGIGVKRGTHVAILMSNCPEIIFVSLALGRIGAVVVPINTACKGVTLAYFLENSRSEYLVVEEDLADAVGEVDLRDTLLRRCVLLRAGQGHRLTLPVVPYASLLEDRPLPEQDVPCDALYFLTYTSGTTGPSKGNMLSQAAALYLGLGNTIHHGFRSDDVFYVCLPLFHINALQVSTFGALLIGASVALSERFSASRFWEEINATGATATNLLGSMTNFLWNQPPRPDDSRNSLRLASAAPAPAFARGFEERFGLTLISGYGLSDFAMVSGLTVDDPRSKLGSAGRVRAGIHIRIADDQDFPLPQGQTGHILVRSDYPWTTSSGYFGMPEATVAATRNLWFHTGDRGYLDEDGYLFFVDRAKDSIRRRGENISAYEVEKILDLHPAVRETAAFPVKSEESEDELAVAIVFKEGRRESFEGIIEYCRRNMPKYMVPRYIVLKDELPRNLSQKVEKFRLRAEVESGAVDIHDTGEGRRRA